MKKLPVFLAVMAAVGLSAATTANAANNGKLMFKGTLTATTCEVLPGAGTGGGAAGEINVDLGNVSFRDIGTFAQGNLSTKEDIQLLVTCNGGGQPDSVKMRLVASQGSGLDLQEPKLLRTSGDAKGVGIGLINSNSQLMSLNGNETIDADFVPDGLGNSTATLDFAAVYVLNNVNTVPGSADGYLPFVMDYQ
ncbi:fimbrial protein [Pseudomonas sp. NPDC090201]|uniref:fimbrial protein n=1 Tax=Pseudomonas sp. NPDC090201 TaxID=3364475 RepID=UPI003811B361